MGMKAKRCFLAALALALAMGLLPAASALEGIACEHQWTVLESVPPTCTDAGLELYVCALCGAERNETVPALGHEWGLCTKVSDATCTEDGLIRCFCNRDRNHYEDTALPALGHDWGEWMVVKAATLTGPGLAERRCGRCGAVEQYRIPEQVRRKEYSLTLVMVPVPDSPVNLPAEQFAEGREVRLEFECALVNSGKKDLWIRSFSLNGESELLQTEEPLFLPAGRLSVFTLTRTAAEGDVLPNPEREGAEGLIRSEFCFFGETEKGEAACVSNTVVLSCSVYTDPDRLPQTRLSGIRVTQETVSEPADPAGYQLDEVIRYTVSVANQSGRAFSSVVMTENSSDETLCLTDLQPGEIRTVSREYRVTLEDAANGYVCRTQSLREGGEEPDEVPVCSGLLIVPVTVKQP